MVITATSIPMGTYAMEMPIVEEVTIENEDFIEEVSDIQEIVPDEDISEIEETAEDEMTLAGGRIQLLADRDGSGTGWSWNKSTCTFTLDGANLTDGFDIFCDAKIEVKSDSTISVTSGRAINVTGSSANNVEISGTGTLRLITDDENSMALAGNNDHYEHNITIKGSGLTVYCENTKNSNAIIIGKGELTVTDGATLDVKTSNYAGPVYSAGGTVNVLNGGIIHSTQSASTTIYNTGDGGGVTISGENSLISVDYTGTSSGNIIDADGESNVTITDKGKLLVNDLSSGSKLIQYPLGTIDLRGGTLEAHVKGGSSFSASSCKVYGKSILYDKAALVNSKYSDMTTYQEIRLIEASELFTYKNEGVRFTTMPDAKIGVKTGATTTLEVTTELYNTSETPTVNYQWYKDDVAISGAVSASYTTPALEKGIYKYYCVASAIFSFGERSEQTDDIYVYVNAGGRTVLDAAVNINKSTESIDRLKTEGWAWNKDKKELKLEDAMLQNINIKDVTATIVNEGESIIETPSGRAVNYSGESQGLNITGTGTLTMINRAKTGYPTTIGSEKAENGPLTISGSDLTVNCKSLKGVRYVVEILNQLTISDGAKLNIISAEGNAIFMGENSKLLVEKGSKLNMMCGRDYSAFEGGTGVELTFTGSGTEVNIDYSVSRTEASVIAATTGCSLNVKDNAKLILNNCCTNGYNMIDYYSGSVDIDGGYLEFNAPAGQSLPANKNIIRAKNFSYNKRGSNNYYITTESNYSYICIKDETEKWVYDGNKPYIVFTTEPESKSVVNGSTATLTVAAEIEYGLGSEEIHYQWYKDGAPIDDATSAEYTTEVLTDEQHDYYCVASATVNAVDIEEQSDSARVYATVTGKTVRTEPLRLNNNTASTSDELEGWNWDAEKKLLILDNFTLETSEGYYGIDVPLGTTIQLKGTNKVIMNSSNVAINSNKESGTLIICGEGTLETYTTVSYYGIKAYGDMEVYGTIEVGTKMQNVESGNSDILPELNTSTSKYEIKIRCNNEYGILITTAPQERIHKASIGGKAPTLTMGAKLYGAPGTAKITYKWYATDDWYEPASNATQVATGATLKPSVKERGGKYYYCVISADYKGVKYEKVSKLYAVIVGAGNLKPITKRTNLSSASADKMETEGWSWNAENKTLTLNNIEGFVPFATNSDSYTLFIVTASEDDDVKVELAEGSVNHIDSCCHGMEFKKGKSLTFTGKGQLVYNQGPAPCQGLLFMESSYKELTVCGNAKIKAEGLWSPIQCEDIKITVDDAELIYEGIATTSYAKNSTIHVKKDGLLHMIGGNTISAGNIKIDQGGEMYIDGDYDGLCLDKTNGIGTINVAGVLSVTATSTPIRIFGENAGERFILDGVNVIDPAGKSLADLNTTHGSDYEGYGEKYLLIGPSDYTRTNLTGVSAVTGTTVAGSIVTAGNVTPADATVTYDWQIATSKDSPDELWESINVYDRTLRLDESYVGRYLRVKITGSGRYAGTVYSRMTAPVGASKISLKDFSIDTVSYGRITAKLYNYTRSYEPEEPAEEAHVRAIADDPNAVITIKNTTSDFTSKTEEEKTLHGSEGEIPICIKGGATTDNKFEITVENGTEKAVYQVTLSYKISSGNVSMYNDNNTILTMKDAEDQVVKKLDSTGNAYLSFPQGSLYTITAESKYNGWYPTTFNNEALDRSSTIENNILSTTLKIPNRANYATVFGLRDDDCRCMAPNFTAKWGSNSSYGFFLEARGILPLEEVTCLTGHTGRVYASLFDEDGNEVRLNDATATVPKGFYSWNELETSGIIYAINEEGGIKTLDPAKSYVLKLWYDVADPSRCDMQEITIPAMDLSMDDHHIVVVSPASGGVGYIEKSVSVNGRAFSVEMFPVTSDVCANLSDDGTSVDITVPEEAALGTTYIVVYVKRPNGEVVSEVLKVDIIESKTISTGLTTIAGEMNVYSNDQLVVPVNVIGTDRKIIGAKFVDSTNSSLSDKFQIIAKDDRTVEIKPIVAADSDTTDWAAVAKSYAGTFKSKFEIELEGGDKYITRDTYTLKISAKAPKVSATAVKLNSFYQGSNDLIMFKSSGTVTGVKVDVVKSTVKTPACPDWVSLSEDGRSLVLNNNNLPTNKGSGKVMAKVWVDGYRMPAQIAIPVSATYTEPKLKLSESTITLPANRIKFSRGVDILLQSNDKKVDFADLDITSVRVASIAELSAKEIATYGSSRDFYVNNYDKATGKITLNAYTVKELSAGKILLIATVGENKKQTVRLPLTIKTLMDNKITIKMDKKSLTLNSNKAVGTEKVWANLVPSAMGYDDANPVITVTDTKGLGDYSDKLDIYRNAYYYQFSTNANTTDGTYRVSIGLPGISKPATIDVIVKASVPSIIADKKAVTTDVFADFKGAKKQIIKLKLSDSSMNPNWGQFSYKLYDSRMKPVDNNELSVGFSGSGEVIADIAAKNTTKLGKYNVEIVYSMPDKPTAQSVAKIAVTVKEKIPAIKPDKSSFKLNPFLGNDELVTVQFARPEGYDYTGYSVSVIDKKNNEVANTVMYNYDNSTGVLTLYPGTNAEAGQTYKVIFKQLVAGIIESKYATSTISVSMLAENKATGKAVITQKVATKGELDLTRPESELKVAPSYVGWMGDSMNKGALGPNTPIISWKVYAYEGKNKAYQYGDPNYQYPGTDGLCANWVPESTGKVDWFIDNDPSRYGVSLKFNPSSDFVKEVPDITKLSFNLEVTTTFTNYYGAGENLVLTTTKTFKVKNGTIKLSAASPDKVVLNRYDRFDSKIVKVELKDSDASTLELIDVKMKDGSCFDATLLYVGGGYAYVAIGWNGDSVPPAIKAGTQTLEFFCGYNYINRDNANGTAKVIVNVQ